MRWREARKYGVTRLAVLRKAMELARDGKCKGTPKDALPAMILAGILDDQDSDLVMRPGFDWQGLIDLISQLLPLILQIITIFGGL